MKRWMTCFLFCLNLPACSDETGSPSDEELPDTESPVGSTGGLAAASGGMLGDGDGDTGSTAGSGGSIGGSGSVGLGGEDGSGGAASPPVVSPDCEFDETFWNFSTEMKGHGFDAFEGKTVYARSRLADCDTAIERPVVGGSFHFILLGVSDGPAYPQYDLFIDANGDGECNETDGDYANATIGVVSENVEVLLEYSPDAPIFDPTPCDGWE